MNKRARKQLSNYLRLVADHIDDNKVEWVAISTKYQDGSRVAMHSNGAPKRPKGMSS